MAAIPPVVRYMLVCDDWRLDGPTNRRVSIFGLIWNINAAGEQSYPLRCREMCVFLALTAGRGQGVARITCVFEETGEAVFQTGERAIPFPPDPLEVVGVPFRIRDLSFPKPGRYSVQFWYDGVQVEERPLQLR